MGTWRNDLDNTVISQNPTMLVEPSVETRYLESYQVSTQRNMLDPSDRLLKYEQNQSNVEKGKLDNKRVSPTSINFETDTKDTETKPTIIRAQKESQQNEDARDLASTKGFVIDFSKKFKTQNLLQASPPSTKVTKSNAGSESINFEKLGLQEVNLELDFRSNDGFRQKKYNLLKESC